MGAYRHLLLDGADDFGVGVAEHHRAVSRPEVDDAVAVDVPLDAALSARAV